MATPYLDRLREKVAGTPGLKDPPAPKAPSVSGPDSTKALKVDESINDNTLMKYVIDYEIPSLKNLPALKMGHMKIAEEDWPNQNRSLLGDVAGYGIGGLAMGLGANRLYRATPFGGGAWGAARGMTTPYMQKMIERAINRAADPRFIRGLEGAAAPTTAQVMSKMKPQYQNSLGNLSVRAQVEKQLGGLKPAATSGAAAGTAGGASGMLAKLKGNPWAMLAGGFLAANLLGGGGLLGNLMGRRQQQPMMTMPMMTMPTQYGR